MAKSKSKKPYYYAGGKRVALEPATDVVAVDDARLSEKLPELRASESALRGGTPLRGGIRLVPIDDLKPTALEQLQKAGVTQPVFRDGSAILVALPEIRVEDDNEAKLAEVRKYAVDKVQPIQDDTEGRLSLRPLSDDGGDAIALANELVERYELTSATPRFLRVVAGPVVRE